MPYSTYSKTICLDEFVIISGNDFILPITIYDELGLYYDLTNCTAFLNISPYGQPNILTATALGIIKALSKIDFFISYSSTLAMSTGKYFYQPVITNSVTSKIYKPKCGIFMIVNEIG